MMRSLPSRLLLTLCLIAASIYGQYPYPNPRTRRGAPGTTPSGASAPKGVILVFKGKLKVLDKKKIVIETEDSELLTIKLTGKTKFLDDGKTIKPAEIDLESPLTVDVNQDADASLLAVNVTVDSPDKKAADKPAAKPN